LKSADQIGVYKYFSGFSGLGVFKYFPGFSGAGEVYLNSSPAPEKYYLSDASPAPRSCIAVLCFMKSEDSILFDSNPRNLAYRLGYTI